MKRMALTDVAIRQAKPREKPYKMGDSLGLFLLVQPTGGKYWRIKYRINGKEKKLAIGAYPDVGISEARRLRDVAREQLAEGKDPAREKLREKRQALLEMNNSFGAIADEFCRKRRLDGHRGWAESTATRSEYLLSQLSLTIGALPVTDIEPIDVLDAVRKIEARGNYESARRTLQLASNVFRYAVATARLKSDPTRDLRGALIVPKVTHYGAITDPEKLGRLLLAIEGYDGHGVVKLALHIAPHVFVRPGELRHARWEEIDLDAAVWTIPAEKTKMRKPHHVPLSRQTIGLFRLLQAVSGKQGYAFPSMRSWRRPLSDNTLNAALRRLGYSTDEMTAHGFRATASTLLNESGKWSPDAIERALAHGPKDRVRAAYHRGTHWEERVKMAQWWSDFLDRLRTDVAAGRLKTKYPMRM